MPMPSTHPPANRASRDGTLRHVALVCVPVTIGGLALLLPPPLVLPAFSMIALAVGFTIAAWAWLAASRAASVVSRDAVGQIGALLVFLGFAAALIADADLLLHPAAPMTAQIEVAPTHQ